MLGRWLSDVPCKPGVQVTNLDLIRKLLDQSELKDRQAVLSFDEMDIKKVYEYDNRNKQVYGPNKKLQVVIVRSLFSTWKETIYFQFDQNMTLDLILSLVAECEARGIQIRGLVCDLGNKTLLSELNFKLLVNKIVNPCDPARYIYLFPDVPHLLKLWRNHCFDDGYSFPDNNGEFHHLNKQHFIDLMLKDGQELKLCPKLKSVHVDAKGSQRQRVYLAAQLFSNSVGKCLTFQGGDALSIQSKAVLTVDRWFDTMNSRTPHSAVPHRCGFGVKLNMQMEALDDMQKLVENMRFSKKESCTTKLPFQQGILVSIRSTKEIYHDMMQLLPDISFIMTCRLNSDISENKFSQIRGIGGDQSHPGPVTAINRMRSLVIVKNAKHLVNRPAVLLPEQHPDHEAEEQHRERFITEHITSREPVHQQVSERDEVIIKDVEKSLKSKYLTKTYKKNSYNMNFRHKNMS